MNYVGVDLHKKTIVLCVMDQDRKVTHRKTFACCEVDAIVAFFRKLGPFQVVVEATASYEWFVELIEPLVPSTYNCSPRIASRPDSVATKLGMPRRLSSSA